MFHFIVPPAFCWFERNFQQKSKRNARASRLFEFSFKTRSRRRNDQLEGDAEGVTCSRLVAEGPLVDGFRPVERAILFLSSVFSRVHRPFRRSLQTLRRHIQRREKMFSRLTKTPCTVRALTQQQRTGLGPVRIYCVDENLLLGFVTRQWMYENASAVSRKFQFSNWWMIHIIILFVLAPTLA